jgi:hypothetical protein
MRNDMICHEDTKTRRIVSFVTSCLRGFILMLLLGTVASAETIDRVLAVVGGQLILLSDVTAARDLGLQTADASGNPVRAVLTKLIDRELVLVEVDRYAPPEPDADAVDRELDGVRARFPSPQAFAAALERSGIDEKFVREAMRQDLRIVAYMNQRFANAGDRRPQLVADWMAGLRRRGDVVDLYVTR